ncbi:hypothetical protein SAMN05216338_105732 [Bradyrhizobium sp. Rc2d]|uniref:hypothetical protein n=1 Tax=Bradyrhizobium sp. Rc2d TaxID=1855321 RepID=UPI0008913FB4|nr:hypothetical protein [Bradyrhizobium sp. Rc2d]SDJ63295.1 hypothetical protein SAMN05216338_105732 [Bradyrhizobium sp. Rc2d]
MKMRTSGQTSREPKLWEADVSRFKPEEGSGIWVKRGDELGYLKYDRLGEEWLASNLANWFLRRSQRSSGESSLVTQLWSLVCAVLIASLYLAQSAHKKT